MTVDPKYIVMLSGKPYPTWPGILDLAHKSGLVSIKTTLLQIPSEENGNVAIVAAEAQFEGGKSFSAIGDASPRNVNAKIATALLRMAETRAKGRALRDGTNCGDTLAEEMPPEQEEREAPAPRRLTVVSSSQGNGASTAACEIDGCGVILTPGQVKVSQANFDGRLLCPPHQKPAKVAR